MTIKAPSDLISFEQFEIDYTNLLNEHTFHIHECYHNNKSIWNIIGYKVNPLLLELNSKDMNSKILASVKPFTTILGDTISFSNNAGNFHWIVNDKKIEL